MAVLRRHSSDVTAEQRAEQRKELVWRPRVVACPVGKSKVGSNSSGRSWGRQVLWGNGFQLAQGCPPEDILEIGGGDGIIVL